MATNNLQLQTKRLNAERLLRCQGIAKVAINALVFGPNHESLEVNVDSRKVDRLKRIFKLEGCDRLDPKHVIPGEIDPNVLREAMKLSSLTVKDLHASDEPRMLSLPQRTTVRCAYGKSRIKALEETNRFDRWWPIELYVNLSTAGFETLTEQFENEGRFSDGHICAMICIHRVNDPTAEKRWWARLTKSKADILRRLLKNASLAPAITRALLQIPGVRAGFEIGTWHKIIGARCPEEVVHYLDHMYGVWTHIMGSREALRLVDVAAVQSLELRAPGISRLDEQHVSTAILSGEVFRSITNDLERKRIVGRVLQVQCLIPSVRTLQKDFKYLRLCTGTLRQLLLGRSRPACSTQTVASDAFRPVNAICASYSVFRTKMKLLYLEIMQSLVELTGESPLMEDGEIAPESSTYDRKAWFRLAKQAIELGFDSEEVSRLAAMDPDRESALTALFDARPPSEYEYDSIQLESLVHSVTQAFQSARPRSAQRPRPALTTAGIGEPIARRCGRQYSSAYDRDRWCITSEAFRCSVPKATDVTSLFVRRCVFHAFWGPVDDETTVPGTISSDESDLSSEMDVDAEPQSHDDGDLRDFDGLSQSRDLEMYENAEPPPADVNPENNEVPLLEASGLECDERALGVRTADAAQRMTRSPTLTQFIPSFPMEPANLPQDQPLAATGDRGPTMVISIRRRNEPAVETQCRRSSIVRRVTEVMNEHPSEMKLYNEEGRGIALDDCLTLTDDRVIMIEEEL